MPDVEKTKVYVKKQGPICKVFMDLATNTPVVISSFKEEPNTAFPMTFTSVAECQNAFKGRELVFIEKEKKEPPTVDPVAASEVDKFLKTGTVKPKPKQTHLSSQAPTTGAPPVKDKVLAFLSKLETANEYASKRNKRILEHKINAVKELIGEVFNE